MVPSLVLVAVLAGPILPSAEEHAGRTTEPPGPAASIPGKHLYPESTASDYIVSPADVLELRVFEVPDISHEYRVSPKGTLLLPLLSEPVPAAGLTLPQLTEIIEQRYRAARVLDNPQVVVIVKESHAHSVTISGSVRNPQVYPVFARTTLLDAIAQAGGLADDAEDTAIVTRGAVALQELGEKNDAPNGLGQPSFSSRTVTVNLRKLMESGDPTLNLLLFPGDGVSVRRAGIVYVIGAVNRPGGFPLKNGQEKMTALKALALAEDCKSTAWKKGARILRENPQDEGGREEITVDLTKVLKGRTPDPRLVASDILYVPDSGSKKALNRAIESSVYITSGLIIWRR